MKFKSSRLKRFNYNINISFEDAKKYKEIIALADSQMLRSIRDITNRNVDLEIIENLYDTREKIKKLPNSKENIEKIKEIQAKIYDMMFIPEYITVVMEHSKHYEYIFRNGLIINGKKYKRFSCSAGQARISTVVLCDEEIIPELKARLNNGRDESVPLAPSKFNAYFGLSGSATKLVSEPKFVVVKDFINQTTFKANFVTETDWNLDDEIDKREVTLEMNRNDGMGLISPRQSALWASNLGLDWTPAQWCIRQNFIKGMLCTFDFHDFCEKKNGGNYVVETVYKDESGNYIKVDLRDFDVIITESQFKLWDSFKSVEQYIENCRENKLYWGVSQYTPKEAKDILTLNYQFIQTLDMDQKDVEVLCSQFIDWVCGVSYDNVPYMLLFLLGTNNDEEKIKSFLRDSDQYWIKSLIVNPELKNDKYIRGKIRDLIKHKIHNGCLGSIIVDGNFQVLVSDPYALMQHLCGQEVTGLLKAGEFYSGYWNSKSIKKVDAMRSPLTYRSEHVILDFIKNNETEYWYQYCQQGIILNYYGHEVVNFSGADHDYDILATTSNPVMIKSLFKNELPVVYNPPKPKKILFDDDDLYHADTFSFGSIIGQITNKGSNGYALLPLLENEYGQDSDEYKLVLSRVRQCCKAQSCQIDKAKIGREVKGIPEIWTVVQKVKCDENGVVLDDEDTLKQKQLYNRTLLNKRPYFFKYLYGDAKKKYNKYYDGCDVTCKQKFKIPLSHLLSLKRKTKEQIEYINNFYKYMPLTYSDSPMNIVCRYIEQINFDIGNKIKSDKKFDSYEIYKNPKFLYTNDEYKSILHILKLHNNSISYKLSTNQGSHKQTYNEDDINEYELDNKNLIDLLNEVNSNAWVVVNCLVDYFYNENPSSKKDILWDTYGNYIFKNIITNNSEASLFPFPSSDGDIIYLGRKYKLMEVEV